MKCLVICQPYAHLILLPTTDPRHKRVENRTWPASRQGATLEMELLIHAGKSKSWLELDLDKSYDINYDLPLTEMVFGAIVGVATLAAWVHIDRVGDVAPHLRERFGWVKDHPHTHGPWCWVLENLRRFPTPVPYKGAQGLFDVPEEEVAAQLLQAVRV